MQRLPRVKDGLEHTFKPVKQHWLSVGGQTTASKEHVSHIFMLWCYRLSTLDGMTSFSFSKHGYYCLNTHLSVFSGFLILLQLKMQIFKNEPHIHCYIFSKGPVISWLHCAFWTADDLLLFCSQWENVKRACHVFICESVSCLPTLKHFSVLTFSTRGRKRFVSEGDGGMIKT